MAGDAVALQLEALFAVHVNVEAIPLATDAGFASKVTTGSDDDATTTVTDRAIWPPGPEQVREKVLVALSAPVGWEPAVVLLPDQAPDAVHDVAFVEFHVKVAEPPLATVVGLAVSVSVGAAGGASTVTVIDRVAVPPSPVHDNEKVLVDVRMPVDCEPDIVLSPDQAPEAVHESAFVELHVRVAVPPLGATVGLALSNTVGAGGGGVPATTTVTDCVAVPPMPEHVKEYALLAARGPVLCEPEVGFAPDHAPDAEHDVAFVDVHVSVAEPPAATAAGSAVSLTSAGTGDGTGLRTTSTATDLESLPSRPKQVNVKVLA